jgi:hypothetical protein
LILDPAKLCFLDIRSGASRDVSPARITNLQREAIPLKLEILIAILVVMASADAATLRVCPSGCDYSNIQTAIEYADPGDTINVSEATYQENITTTKPIAIEGAGIDRTLIDGSYSAPVFTIVRGLDPFGPGPNISISNVTIEHGQADFGGGISNKGGGWITLIGCSIEHNTAYGGGANLQHAQWHHNAKQQQHIR